LDAIEPRYCFQTETRVLGTLIQLADFKSLAIQQAMISLDEQCFYHIQTRGIYAIIAEYFQNQKPFDYISLTKSIPERLYQFYLQTYEGQYFSPSALLPDVEDLIRFKLLRKQIRVLQSMLRDASSAIMPELALSSITGGVQQLSEASSSNTSLLRTYEEICDEILSQTTADNSEIHVAIPRLPPVPNRSLITIAGRSGTGKTFFGLYLMDKLIDAIPDKQSLYFNLEMPDRVMIERHARLLGIRGDSRVDVIRNGAHLLIPKGVSLISVPQITIDQIESESRIASFRKPISVIVVDYLGLIRSKSRYDRNDLQQSDIAKRLAALSLELDCIVICLIQANRDYKNRPVGNRIPFTTDAAESMGSVHSSSWWLGIDRPEIDSQEEEYSGLFQIACRKNRGDAGLFTLDMNFKGGQFYERRLPFSSYVKKSPEDGAKF
jgi:replicative DNA helicase